MKKLVNENLFQFRENRISENIEIYKISQNKNGNKKFSLIPIGEINESSSIHFDKLEEALSKDPHSESGQMEENESQMLFFKIAKKLKEKKLVNFPGEKIKQIGEGGTNGFAYDLGEQILKITVDKVEANNKIKLIGKSPKTLVKVYEVLVVKYTNKENPENESTYFFVIKEEKLSEIGKTSLSDAAALEPDLLSRKLRAPLLAAGESSDGKITDEIKKIYSEYMKSARESGDKILMRNRSFLLKLHFEMGLFGIFSDDYTVPENIGKRGKDLIFFDIGGKVPMGGTVKNPSAEYTNLIEKPSLELTSKIPFKPGKKIKD